MTKEQSKVGLQATIICCGYNVGFCSISDIEWWAIQQIDALDEPPMALIDLTILRDTNPIDVMNLLRSRRHTFAKSNHRDSDWLSRPAVRCEKDFSR